MFTSSSSSSKSARPANVFFYFNLIVFSDILHFGILSIVNVYAVRLLADSISLSLSFYNHQIIVSMTVSSSKIPDITAIECRVLDKKTWPIWLCIVSSWKPKCMYDVAEVITLTQLPLLNSYKLSFTIVVLKIPFLPFLHWSLTKFSCGSSGTDWIHIPHLVNAHSEH
jgi:hypothetical protein